MIKVGKYGDIYKWLFEKDEIWIYLIYILMEFFKFCWEDVQIFLN